MRSKTFFLIMLLLCSVFSSFAQKTDSFKNLGGAEKLWVVLHPFSAEKAYEISNRVDSLSKEMVKAEVLDGDGSGGKVDAFRHAYWMALMASEIGKRKSRWLGKAHEKKNRKQFQRGQLENGDVPDLPSMEMDLHNNEVGIAIAREHPKMSAEVLKQLVMEVLEKGGMLIIKKDREGNSLDSEGEIIPTKEWEGKWENRRVLVKSDYKQDL